MPKGATNKRKVIGFDPVVLTVTIFMVIYIILCPILGCHLRIGVEQKGETNNMKKF